MANERIIFNFLVTAGLTKEGAAGLMGNLCAESHYMPNNLQNSFNKKLGLSDEEYTKRVNDGTYTNFIKDKAGYGLAQWTYWSRKQKLYDYIKSKGKSIDDLNSQLEYLVKELKTSYPTVWRVLIASNSIKECSDLVLHCFEKPANQSTSVENQRYKNAQEAYNLCTNSTGILLEVGSIVYFKGGCQYINSKAPKSEGKLAKSGKVKITQVAKNGIHQYHVIHFDSSSNVYGWVDKDALQ